MKRISLIKGALRSDLYRCLSSPLFALSVIMIAASQLLGSLSEMRIFSRMDVLYYYSAQEFDIAPILLAAMPFSAAFCMDYKNRFVRYSAQRSSIKAYAWSKTAVCALSGGLAVMLGMTLFFAIMRLRFPLIDPSSSIFESRVTYMPFGPLLGTRFPWTYFAMLVIMQSLGAMIYSSVAMAVSGWAPNLFVALSSPILFYYLLVNGVPQAIWHFNPLYIYHNMTVDVGGIGKTIAFALIYMLSSVAILGTLFEIGMRRRLLNG